jgi:serine/threonine protein kinase
VYSFAVEEDGLMWIAMELVQGVTLGEWLRSQGPMSLDQFAPFFEAVAQVVQAAHGRGIVHRDLKPSNIMVIESAGRLFPSCSTSVLPNWTMTRTALNTTSLASRPRTPWATTCRRREFA